MMKNVSNKVELDLIKVQSKNGAEYFIREGEDLHQIDEDDDF